MEIKNCVLTDTNEILSLYEAAKENGSMAIF